MRNIVSIILTTALILGVMPISAFADDGNLSLGVSGTITAFAPLDELTESQYYGVGEKRLDELDLPDSLTATLGEDTAATSGDTAAQASEITVPVSGWQSEPAYNPDALGTYVFTPMLDLGEDYAVADGVELPRITVEIKVPMGIAAAATAANYTLYYNKSDGELHKGSGDGEVYTEQPGKWSGSGNTLSLDGFVFETDADVALILPAGSILELSGINTVTSIFSGLGNGNTSGVFVDGTLTATGTGSLEATGGTAKAGYSSVGLHVGGHLIADGGTLIGNGGDVTSGNPDSKSFGMEVKDDLTANGGLVKGVGGKSYGQSFGVFVTEGNLIVNSGSIVEGIGGEARLSSSGIYVNQNDLNINGGTLTGTGGESKYGSFGIFVSDYLTASGGVINAAGNDADIDSYGIAVMYGGLTVSGTAAITAESGAIPSTSAGMSCGIFMDESDLTVSGGTIVAESTDTGASYGIYLSDDFAMTGGTIYAKGNMAAAMVQGVVPANAIIKGKSGSDYTVDGMWAANGCTVITATPSTLITDAKITVSGADYTLYYSNGTMHKNDANGTVITPTDVPGWSSNGTTLNLSGIDFETTAAIALKVPDGTKIVLATGSTNKIASIYDMTSGGEETYGVKGAGDLTVEGNGRLGVSGGKSDNISCGIGLGVIMGSFVMNGGIIDVSGGESVGTVDSGSYGLQALDGVTINGGKLTVSGGKAADVSCGLSTEQTLKLSNGAKLIASGGKAAASGGLSAGNVSLVAGCEIIGTGGDATKNSYGLFVGGLNITGGKLTGVGGEAVGTQISESRGLHSEPGVYNISGGEIIATGGKAAGKSLGLFVNTSNFNITGGRLIATGGGGPNESYGLFAYVSSRINMSGGELIASGGKHSYYSAGVCLVNTLLTMSGGVFTASGGDAVAESWGMYVTNVFLTGGALSAEGGNASNGTSYGLFSEGELFMGRGMVSKGGNAYFKGNDNAALFLANSREFDKWIVKGADSGGNYTIAAEFSNIGYNPAHYLIADSETMTPVLDALIAIDVNVSFNANGGNGTMPSVSLKKGDTYILPANPFTHTNGDLFAGWRIGNAGGLLMPGMPITISDHINLYAQWAPVGETAHVNYNANGGTGNADAAILVAGSTINLPPNPFTNAGNYFGGWKIDNAGSLLMPGIPITVCTDITLYAQWTPVGQTVYVDFDANGGTGNADTAILVAGSTINLPSNPFTRNGYTFTGWKIDNFGFLLKPGESIAVNADFTLYAQWAAGGGSSGGGSSKQDKSTPSAPVIAPLDNKASGTLNNAINAAANSNSKNLDVKLKNVSNLTKENAAAIIKKAKALGKKATVSSDVMSEDGKSVEVRVTLAPELITKTVRLDGYIRESQIMQAASRFKKHFSNKTTVVHLGQEGKFGQTAKIAAKVDLAGFDIDNLYFYSYDKKTNQYTRIEKSAYRIDKNGYLHFETDNGGDIIISDGPLKKK